MWRRIKIITADTKCTGVSKNLPKSAEVLSSFGHGLAEEPHDNAASVGIADLNVKEDLAGDLLEVPVNDGRAKQLGNKWDVR